MTHSPLRAACAALFVMALLASCSRGTKPVARVGDRTLTVDDFAALARGNEANFPGSPEQAKAMMLQELVRRELVAMAARAHGLDTLPEVRNFARVTRETVMLEELYRRLSPLDVDVSEAELKAFYEARAQQATLQLIYNPLRPVVDIAAAQIAAGEPFGEVARQHNSPGTLPPGGVIGTVSYGDLFPPLDELVRTLPVGKVEGPFSGPRGWFLAQVTHREPAKRQPFETQRSLLEQMLRRRKTAQMQVQAQLALEAAYHARVEPEGVNALFRLLEPSRDASVAHWTPDETEKRQVLVSFDGGTYTLGDAMDDLLEATTRGPDPMSITSCSEWCEERALRRIGLLEAGRRHIAEEPPVAREIKTRIALHVMEAEATLSAVNVGTPTEEMARDAWNGIKGMYPMVRTARVQWVVSQDTAVANALVRSRGNGGTLRDAARAIAPALIVREETLRYPQPDAFWNNMQPLLAQIPLGERVGPQMADDGLRVVQLLARDAAPLEWEQLPPQARQNLMSSLVQRAQQERLGTYLDSLWQATKPVLMPENLARLPWPLPALARVGT